MSGIVIGYGYAEGYFPGFEASWSIRRKVVI